MIPNHSNQTGDGFNNQQTQHRNNQFENNVCKRQTYQSVLCQTMFLFLGDNGNQSSLYINMYLDSVKPCQYHLNKAFPEDIMTRLTLIL